MAELAGVGGQFAGHRTRLVKAPSALKVIRSVHVCVRVCEYVCVHVCPCMCAHTYVYVCLCMCVSSVYACVYVCPCVCVCPCVHVRTRTCRERGRQDRETVLIEYSFSVFQMHLQKEFHSERSQGVSSHCVQ